MVRLAVGIAGHHRLDESLFPVLKESLEKVFGLISEHAKACSPRLSLSIVSSLADNLDLQAAEIAIKHNFELLAPIPFPIVEHERELVPGALPKFRELIRHSKTRVIELDYVCRARIHESTPINKSAFEASARVMLGQSDILVAVWDGCRERGPGGTGQTVREAREREIPVVWIDALHPERIGLLQNDACGEPDFGSIVGLTATASTTSARINLQTTIADILDRPNSTNKRADLCAEYLKERNSPNAIRKHSLFVSLYDSFYRRIAPPLSHPPIPEVQLNGPIAQIWNFVGKEFAVADALALKYAGMYRSAFLVNYLLGALAVTFALIGGVLLKDHEPHRIAGLVCAGLEFVFLSCMCIIWFWSHRKRWQDKFTDYRLLAEHLRHLRYLLPLGLIPATRAVAHEPEHLRRHWVNWYLRGVARDTTYANLHHSDREFQRQMLALVHDHWVQDQLEYQKSVRRRTHHADKRLTIIGGMLVVFTIAISICHFFKPEWHFLWFFAALFPACATAVHAIAQRAECKRLHKRSGAMVLALRSILHRLDKMKDFFDKGGKICTWQISAIAQETATAMLQEAFDWRIQYRMGEFHPA
jgi:hypothetical protein